MNRNLGNANKLNVKFDDRIQKIYHSPTVIKAFKNICVIAELLKKKDRDNKVSFNCFLNNNYNYLNIKSYINININILISNLNIIPEFNLSMNLSVNIDIDFYNS